MPLSREAPTAGFAAADELGYYRAGKRFPKQVIVFLSLQAAVFLHPAGFLHFVVFLVGGCDLLSVCLTQCTTDLCRSCDCAVLVIRQPGLGRFSAGKHGGYSEQRLH